MGQALSLVSTNALLHCAASRGLPLREPRLALVRRPPEPSARCLAGLRNKEHETQIEPVATGQDPAQEVACSQRHVCSGRCRRLQTCAKQGRNPAEVCVRRFHHTRLSVRVLESREDRALLGPVERKVMAQQPL